MTSTRAAHARGLISWVLFSGIEGLLCRRNGLDTPLTVMPASSRLLPPNAAILGSGRFMTAFNWERSKQNARRLAADTGANVARK